MVSFGWDDAAQWGILIVTIGGIIYHKIKKETVVDADIRALKADVADLKEIRIVDEGDCGRRTEKLNKTLEGLHMELSAINLKLQALEDDQKHDRITRDNRLAQMQSQLDQIKECQDRQRGIIDDMPKIQATVSQLKESTDKLNTFLMDLVSRHFEGGGK